MPNLIRYQKRAIVSRTDARQFSRTLGSLSMEVAVETGRIEAAADIQAVKTDAVAYVGKRGMQNIAMVSQLEQQLVLMAPAASGRLQAIAEITALSIAEVVGDTLRQVR